MKKGIISQLKSANKKQLDKFYELYKKYFCAFLAAMYKIDAHEQVSIYNDSFIAMLENIKKGRLTDENLTSDIKTYLLKIGKNQASNYNKKKERYQLYEFTEEVLNRADMDEGQEVVRRKNEIIYDTISTLKDPCNTVLSLSLWTDCEMKDIAEEMGYGSVQVAKNTKSRCIKKLRVYLENKFEEEGIK